MTDATIWLAIAKFLGAAMVVLVVGDYLASALERWLDGMDEPFGEEP